MSDLNELMDRDPLDLSDEDLDGIIEYLRAQRVNFLAGNKKAGTNKEKPVPVSISLDELGL